MMVSKRDLLFQGATFRFHVKLQGCTNHCHSANMNDDNLTTKIASTLILPKNEPKSTADLEMLLGGPLEDTRKMDEWGCWCILLMVQNSGVHQLRLVVYPIIYEVLDIPGGTRYLPSTVGLAYIWVWHPSARIPVANKGLKFIGISY